MNKTFIINKLKHLDHNARSIIKSAQSDTKINSNGITKEQVVNSLKSDGMRKVSDAVLRATSYEEIERNIPDIKLVKNLVIANILSPNDLINININYEFDNVALPNKAKEEVLNTIKTHLKTQYDFEDRQYNIVGSALFEKGAFCQLIIPNEEYVRHTTDTLTTGSIVKVESDISLNVSEKASIKYGTVTNDLSVLKILNKKVNAYKLEDDRINNSSQLDLIVDALMQRHSTRNGDEIIYLSKSDLSNKKPLVMDIPFESVIPITDPSSPDLHYGYYILLDDNGKPINKYSDNSNYGENYNGSKVLHTGFGELNPQTANNVMLGDKGQLDIATHKPLNYDIFRTAIEDTLKTKLKDMINGEEVGDTELELIMKTMFFRSLSSKETKILYVPESMLAYYAFYYGDDGVGKSVYYGISDLLSMKKFLMVLTYLSYCEQLIPLINVEVNIDDIGANDIQSYLAETKSVILENKINPFINLGTNPYNLTEMIRQHGIVMNLKHNDIDFPTISEDRSNREFPEVNEDLIKLIDNCIYNEIGVVASVVQDGYENEYAVVASGKQKIIGKISSIRAKIHMSNMAEHVKKILSNDGELKTKICKILNDNYKEILSNLFKTDESIKQFTETYSKENIIDTLYKKLVKKILVKLPEPPSDTDNEQKEKLEAYKDAIDDAFENMFNKDAFPEDLFGENVGNVIESVGKFLKAKLLKEKMEELPFYNDITKELNNFLNNEKEDEVTKYIKSFIEKLENKIIPKYALLKKVSDKRNETFEAIAGGDAEGSDYDSDNDNDDNSDNDSGDDTGGDEDVDGGDDLGLSIEDMPEDDGEEGVEEEGDEDKEDKDDDVE